MKIITSGNYYIDIDAYAGCIAFLQTKHYSVEVPLQH